MSQTTVALLAKLGVTFVAAWLTLGFMDNNTIGLILLTAIIGTILNYLLGDLLVLPKLGNIIASLGDAVMGAFVAYLISVFFPTFKISSNSLLIFAALIGVAEYFFHMYLYKSEKVAP